MSEPAPIVAFAGPSLRRERALEILGPEGIVLPPASAGDLLRALRLGPRSIVLLDGRFDDVPSPWHKEILIAIEYGVHVFGGASMGALRAIECEPFGAMAIGEIADSYRSGRREDDAVAISHLPAAGGWQPMSTALVDIEAVIEARTNEGTITEEHGRELIRKVRKTPFPMRSMPEDVRASTSEPGLKERDAVLTCRKAAETGKRRRSGSRVPRTTWLLRLARIALGSPFPRCPGLPEIERRFRDAVDTQPWIAPLLSDAITFGSVRTPTQRSALAAHRRETLLEHHLSRVPRDGSLVETGKKLAQSITNYQVEILEANEGIGLAEDPCSLIEMKEDHGARDDLLARVLRSEGIPPIHDDILEVNPASLAGMIDAYLELKVR